MSVWSFELSVPPNVSQLDALNEYQIRDLLANPESVHVFANEISGTLREMRNQQQMEIGRIAKRNLEHKKEIKAITALNEQIRDEIQSLSEVHGNLQQRKGKIMGRFSKGNINKLLDTKIDELNGEHDEIKEKLENDEISMVIFLKRLIENRRKFHLLTIKQEKYNQLH